MSTKSSSSQSYQALWKDIEQAKTALWNHYNKAARVFQKLSKQAVAREQVLTKRLKTKQDAYRDLKNRYKGKKSPTMQKRLDKIKENIDHIKSEKHYCMLLKRGYSDALKQVDQEKKQMEGIWEKHHKKPSPIISKQKKASQSVGKARKSVMSPDQSN